METNNSRHYLVFLDSLYESVPVPEVFREKLGRIYETPPEGAGDDYEPVEVIPSVRQFVEHHGIPVLSLNGHKIFGIPMLDHREMREAEQAQAQLVQVGAMEADAVWIHNPPGIRRLIAEWRALEIPEDPEA